MDETVQMGKSSWNRDELPAPGQRVHKLIVTFDTGKWQTTGVLGALGYHVGKNGITNESEEPF